MSEATTINQGDRLRDASGSTYTVGELTFIANSTNAIPKRAFVLTRGDSRTMAITEEMILDWLGRGELVKL